MAEPSASLGIDIGGTKIAAGVVDQSGNVVESTHIPTPKTNADDVLNVIEDVWKEFSSRHDLGAIGISAAGLVNKTMDTVVFAPHVPWANDPLAQSISERTHTRVVVENDANAAAWAEHRFGAVRDVNDFLMVAIGTGIGGGVFIDGKPYRGAHGMAGEIGHIVVDPQGLNCECGQRGCWEQYASGNALGRIARDYARAGKADSVITAAGSIEDIRGNHVTELLARNNDEAKAILAELAHWLGVGIASLIAIFDPETVVVGGGLSHSGEALLVPTRAIAEALVIGGSSRLPTTIVAAQLGNNAALIGAADLARG